MNRIGAFLLAPVPAAVAGALLAWVSGGWPRPVSLTLFYLLFFYAAQLALGLPIRAWLIRTGRTSALAFSFGGLVMVALPVVPYMLWALGRGPETAAKGAAVLSLWLLMGALTGAVAWYLSRSAPDRRA